MAKKDSLKLEPSAVPLNNRPSSLHIKLEWCTPTFDSMLLIYFPEVTVIAVTLVKPRMRRSFKVQEQQYHA